MDIQWYPGHMTKTKRLIVENLSLVDVVVEVLDARIPYSSKNPDIDKLAKDKLRLIVLNKADLADQKCNETWIQYYKSCGIDAILTNCAQGKGVNDIVNQVRVITAEKVERQKQRGRLFVPIRLMIAGIPNSGKSTLINRLVGQVKAKTGDKPGVTRGKQWIKLAKDLDLLDTPGILWPKFSDERVGEVLAITGAINDQIIDMQTLALRLIEMLMQIKPQAISELYKIEIQNEVDFLGILHKIGEKRGFLVKGGNVDYNRTSIILLNEFRAGKLGKISLETPTEY